MKRLRDTPPTGFIKVVMKVRYFDRDDRDIVLPVGRCLEVVLYDGYCVIVKVGGGLGDISFQMNDPRVAFASQDEFNDCKTHA